ncbi:hypothetical protein [Streptomyces tsukubensis]|uniref:hypothetical protein n=1 Tax=Streptomyces tsukubensis TaxID=83656 RepID=UPI00117D771C|nr:hypothetical protein [Streptomyces tsukubensis]QFR96680.1 hypothetical protein GBW32_31175 [Streptomyces tsukubensis]
MSDSVRFSYSFTPTPSPLTVSDGTQPAPGAVTVTVRNETHGSVDCKRIEFVFTQGDDGSAFSTTNGMPDVRKGCSPKWWFTKDPVGQKAGHFVAEPENAAVPDGAVLQFAFLNIPVNAFPGQARLVVTEHTDGGTRTTTLYVPKSQVGFVLRDFASALADIQVGAPVDLLWTARLPVAHSQLLLTYGSYPPQDVTAQTTCTTRPLHEDTAFELTAVVPQPSDAQPVRYTLNTFVTVNNGYLTTTKLTVEGEFLALGPRVPEPMPALPTGTFDGTPHRLQALAGTDGFLIGSLRSFTKDSHAVLEIAVKSGPADPHVTVLRCTGADADDPDPYSVGRPVTIPVPNNSAVSVTWTMSAPGWPPTTAKDATIPFSAIFAWHPWGTGTIQAGPIR